MLDRLAVDLHMDIIDRQKKTDQDLEDILTELGSDLKKRVHD